MLKEEFYNIKNSCDGYEKLLSFYSKYKDTYFEKIYLNINGWFSANLCSILGAILARLQHNMNDIEVSAGKAIEILKRNGFLAFFGQMKTQNYNHTTIPYQVLSKHDERYFNNYVFNEFINKPDLPSMSVQLKEKLAEAIYEIFINATIHSKTDKIFVCGQFFPQKHKIDFMITDTGLGIKNVVNNTFDANLSAVQAIRWAVEDRNTTKQGISGGIGLAILKEFINGNGGKIQILSNEGYWELCNSKISTHEFKSGFDGTMVNISVRTDDNCTYSLINKDLNDIF